MATAPDDDVYTRLAAAVPGLTAGTNLFTGPVREVGDTVPGECVFVLASGGAAPQAYAGPTAVETRFSGVQVRVRSAKQSFDAGETLARAVCAALHHQQASMSGYINVRALQSEPLYIGEDKAGYHGWSINLELVHDQ